MEKSKLNLTEYMRSIPDWPKKGILFRDITPLLADKDAFSAAIEIISDRYKNKKIDYVAAVEARGFIFGAAVAARLGVGFVPIRKKGKLPYKTESATYGLEYGKDTIQVHSDAVKKGANVLMVDDLLATGGTMAAACSLIEKIGGSVAGIAFLVELKDLNGREKLKNYDISVEIVF
ncbi:MAG: adenine phosphoribosyltransferase [Phycisphaerae bacterium]|nr:adenine phosphoribosyltransferase [Phycisphaerae bacterium]